MLITFDCRDGDLNGDGKTFSGMRMKLLGWNGNRKIQRDAVGTGIILLCHSLIILYCGEPTRCQMSQILEVWYGIPYPTLIFVISDTNL